MSFGPRPEQLPGTQHALESGPQEQMGKPEAVEVVSPECLALQARADEQIRLIILMVLGMKSLSLRPPPLQRRAHPYRHMAIDHVE